MERVFSSRIVPLPLQFTQNSSITLPSPLQAEQVCCIEKNPCCILIWPAPLQVLQVLGLEPGFAPDPSQGLQGLSTGNLTVFLIPRIACLRVKSTLI